MQEYGAGIASLQPTSRKGACAVVLGQPYAMLLKEGSRRGVLILPFSVMGSRAVEGVRRDDD